MSDKKLETSERIAKLQVKNKMVSNQVTEVIHAAIQSNLLVTPHTLILYIRLTGLLT